MHLLFLLILNSVSHINLGCFEHQQGNFQPRTSKFYLSSSLKLLKILCTASSISLYIPEYLSRLLWLGCLSCSGYFVSSGNTFVETSISVVPVCHHLAETVYFSLPLKWNWKFPIYWIVLKWTWLLLRLPFFPARRPSRQGWNLTMIGILFLIKYAAKSQSICGSNEILLSGTSQDFLYLFLRFPCSSYLC